MFQDVGLEINHSIAEIRIGMKALMAPTLNPSLKLNKGIEMCLDKIARS